MENISNCIKECIGTQNKQFTFEDLRPRLLTHRAYVKSGSGRDKVYGYRSGIQCNAGDIEEAEWQRLLSGLIRRSGEEELHEQLKAFVKTNYPWCRTKAEIEKEALHLHSVRIFDNEEWVCFMRFNRQHRPEILARTELVRIITACCKEPADTTLAQVKKARGSHMGICCPICGRWAAFEEMSSETAKGKMAGGG